MKSIKSAEFIKYLSGIKGNGIVQLICPHCNQQFVKTKNSIINCFTPSKNQLAIFCSRNCANDHIKKTESKLCINCGVATMKTPSDIRRRKSNNFFCSQSCSASFNNKLRPRREKRPKVRQVKYCFLCHSVNDNQNSKFCSQKCRKKSKLMSYVKSSKKLFNKRKNEFIKLKGGHCQICGYNKNRDAMVFHHINPCEKKFKLDSTNLRRLSLTTALIELEKCTLLCVNCHVELHNPKFQTCGCQ